MSDADTTAEPTVTEGEITVRKSYETDEFPVPAVAFDISSERKDEAMVRVVDTVPEGIPAEDLGFHPDYGSDHWSVEDGNPVFERRLDPGEEYLTVYGIRTSDHDPEQFMTEPSLDVRGLGDDTETEEAEEPDETEETDEAEESEEATTPGSDSSQAARDVISGEGTVSGLDDEDETVEEVDISGTETDETDQPTEASETDDEGTNDAGRTDERSGEMTLPDGGVGAALAAELRDGNLSESDRELLTEELNDTNAGSEVRLTHLQSRISDLEAYTDALEEFIDEHGPARQLIEDLTDQLETVEAELDSLDDRTSENESAIQELDGRIEENANDIGALDAEISDVNADISEIRDSVGNLREDVDKINGWRTQISTVLGAPPESKTEES
ncbi:MAG TPA: hypothetical protein VFJ06_14875 [Halococcus sp.]|nr:hypothetical protein [Halococcus sp.]